MTQRDNIPRHDRIGRYGTDGFDTTGISHADIFGQESARARRKGRPSPAILFLGLAAFWLILVSSVMGGMMKTDTADYPVGHATGTQQQLVDLASPATDRRL